MSQNVPTWALSALPHLPTHNHLAVQCNTQNCFILPGVPGAGCRQRACCSSASKLQPPGHGVVLVVQRLDALGTLAPRQAVRVGGLEEAGGELRQPLRVDRQHLACV